jgi:hypothetical protein
MTSALFPADVSAQYLKTDPASMVAQSGGKAYLYGSAADPTVGSTGTDYKLQVELEDTNASGPGVQTVDGKKVYEVTNKQ